MTIDILPSPTVREIPQGEIELPIELMTGNTMFEENVQKKMPLSLPRRCPFSSRPVKMTNVTTTREMVDTLHQKAINKIACKESFCVSAMMSGQSPARPLGTMRPKTEIKEHAKLLLDEYFTSIKKGNSPEYFDRLEEVMQLIESTGTYDLTKEELSFGAKLAWRNAPRCIGRIQWQKLEVFDCRDITTAREMFEAICTHIKYGTNEGNLRSAITVFPKREEGKPDFKVWNPQFFSYAGYEQEDGTVIGDPSRVKFTQICESLGWKGKGGRFDVLPLVLNASGEDPQFFEIPEDLIFEVELKHPKYPWFEDMGLKWYVLPAVADMLFDVGGLEFPAAPFNGWYLSTEIGTRNLCDPHRYNILEEVAVNMGLDTSSAVTLWKDQALVEINVAVLYSFQLKNVTISDHHTASETFMKHMENEQRLRGGCPADWVWIVPPLSGGITPVFHQEMLNYNLKPSYEYQEKAWKTHAWIDKVKEVQTKGVRRNLHFRAVARAILFAASMIKRLLRQRIKTTVLYATETGKSETYAKRVADIFRRAFHAEVMCMDEYDLTRLSSEQLLLVVTSTFGSGDAPDNGKQLHKELKDVAYAVDKNQNRISQAIKDLNLSECFSAEKLRKVRYSVFALGSSAYPDFCQFGKFCDKALDALGAQRVLPVATGDELKGQENSFRRWTQEIFNAACKTFNIESTLDMADIAKSEEEAWQPDRYRLYRIPNAIDNLSEGLSKVHNRKVMPCKLISRVNLQSPESERQTVLVKLDTRGASELNYEAGDHLGICPTNAQDLVYGIMKRLKNAPAMQELIQVQTVASATGKGGARTWKPVERLPACTLFTALSQYLDITTPPSQQLLATLAQFCTENEDKQNILNLAKNENEYEQWRDYRFPTLLEVLEQFPSLRPDTALLLTQLPLLQPRFYSISSAPKACPGEIHVTVGVVTFKTQDGKGPLHHGVCSTYLNKLPEKDVPCFIRKAPEFKLPEDRNLPVILVGPGTGIAPFRSFWQQRRYEMELQKKTAPKASLWPTFRNCQRANDDVNFGKMMLYFGCRHPDMDDIYAEELSSLLKQGVFTKVQTAYSRLPGKPKCYVQHMLKSDAAAVFRNVCQNGGHVYVCGEAAMAADVRATLKEIFKSQGSMTQEAAEHFFNTMKENGQYHEDIFGVLVKSSSIASTQL